MRKRMNKRNINHIIIRLIKTKNTENEKKEEEKKNIKESNSGLAQIRMINLILEICYTQKDIYIYEREEMKKEVKKLEKIRKHKDDLIFFKLKMFF